ncbi:MAG TPA: YciI family protein [Acidimicrobiales bacterium]|jgi:hypothetical protein|nr:YciI family protein [Acidimicrobiales bacterium]
MKYMLLIYVDGTAPAGSAEDQSAMTAEYGTFTQEILASGELVAGEQLADPDTATSVRVRDGETLTTDGPFAETRELLAGFYIIEAPDLDRALAVAAKIPGARTGVVEVRPVVDMAQLMG